MIEAIFSGLNMVMTAKVGILMLIATLIGNFFGLLPALGGVVMLTLMIPFVYGWVPFEGLAFLLAAHAVVNTGGAIPSILFGIPGQGACVATIIDGHPMAKQGKAGEAMGAQLCASGVGGVLGAVVLALCIPFLKPILMAFGPAETLMLGVFGLTFIIVIGRENLLRGFISACFGLLLGTIGSNPFTGENRFSFGQLWLFDGLNIVVMPRMRKAPRRTAIPALPGMPKTSVGSNAPPSLELFAASTPMTPRMSPLPKFSLFLQVCTACP